MLYLNDIVECVPSARIFNECAVEIGLIGNFTRRTDFWLAKLLTRIRYREHIRGVMLSIVSPCGELAVERSLPRLIELSRDPQRRLIAHIQSAVGPTAWLSSVATAVSIDRSGRYGLGEPFGGEDSSRVPPLFWEAISELRPQANCRNIGDQLLSAESCEARELVDGVCHSQIARSLLLQERTL